MKVTDIVDIRIQNVSSIIQAVRFESGITKKDIAEKTNLSFATVSNLCNELVDKGVLMTTRDSALSVGRTPLMLRLRYNHFLVIAINLQLRGVMDIAVMNLRNEIIASQSYEIDENMEAVQMIRFAKRQFDADLKNRADSDAEYIGVGVAVSSIYDIHTSRLICCAIPQLENVAMKAAVEQEFGLKAFIDNEANLCARALSAGTDREENGIYIHASQGVGIGIKSRGNLLRGANGYAGEVAHIPLGNSEHVCRGCGLRGCIERELCMDGILENYLGVFPEDRFSGWQQFLEEIRGHKEAAMHTAHEAGHYLGVLSGMLIGLFDPDTVYIGGEIAALEDQIKEEVLREVHMRCGEWRRTVPELVWDHNSPERINVGISEKIFTQWHPTETA